MTFDRNRPAVQTLLFVTGFLTAWALFAVLPDGNSAGAWVILVPFLLAVGAFAVFAVLFVLQARTELGQKADGAGRAFEAGLTDACSGFDARMEEALAEVRVALKSGTREGEIVFEADFDNEDKQSRCYKRLIELVDGAQKSLFAIPNPYRQGTQDVLELNWRDEYLRTIERRIADKHAAGEEFEYIRIQQVPPGTDRAMLNSYMGKIESAHVARLQDMPYGNAKLMVIDNDEITGQLVIDERIFVNLISAVDQKGRKRMVAIGIMTDPLTDSVSKYYRKLKSTLMAKARLIFDL